MKGPAKVYVTMGLTLVVLLMMYHLPQISLGDVQLRQIDVLADLDADTTADATDTIAPKKPAPKGSWTDVWPEGVEPIEDYGTDSTGGMDSFYAALAKGKKLGRPVRVAYLSDSFVEGDIMLVDLRHILQQHFGNGGLGWMRCRTNFDEGSLAATLSSSGFTPRHTMTPKDLNYAQYILPQGYCEVSATATASVAPLAGSYTPSWSRSTVWGYTTSGATVSGSPTGGTVRWKAANGVQKAQFNTPHTSRFTATVSGSAKVFGMSLETDSGIVVDNFGVRGASGLTLARMAEGLAKDFARQRPYDLIVIHFGLNVLEAKSTSKKCTWYTSKMKDCVNLIKRIYPQSAVLIVSASDRAQRDPATGKVRTLPAVPMLVRSQQQLAADMGVGYLNLFHLMGGKNSVVDMVNKHLAEKDYTHINRKGGKWVAERFAKSVVAGFDNYQRKKAAGY